MQGSLDRPPIVLHSKGGRAVLLVAISAIFIALTLFQPASAGLFGNRFLGLGLFGFLGLTGVWMLVAPNRLEIAPSGLTQKVLWRTRKFAWAEIYNFRAIEVGLTTKMVGFDYLTESPKRRTLKRLSSALSGVQDALQPNWEIRSQDLANLLNEARERWLEIPEGAAQPGVYANPRQAPLLAALTGTRADRKSYWMATAVVFAVVVAMAFVPAVRPGLTGVTPLLFVRIYASRLHDFGRSGRWQLLLYVVQVSAVILIVRAGVLPSGGAVGVGFVIQFAFTAAIGAIPGNPGTNRFGPPPNQPSAIAIAETFR